MAGPYRDVPIWVVPIRFVVRYFRYLRLFFQSNGRLAVGKNVVFGGGCYILAPEMARFGNNVAVGLNFHVEQNIMVGDDVLISSNVAVIGNDHPFDDPKHTIFSAPRAGSCAVVLEGDNLIGFGVTIIGGVKIGKGCVVGARSVVTRDLPPNTICFGIPARPVRQRFTSTSKHCS